MFQRSIFILGLALAVSGCRTDHTGDSTDPGTDDSGTQVGADADGDGYTVPDDCDDTEAAVNPGATEICDDGIDNNCDGAADGADAECSGGDVDADGDGYTTVDDCNDSDPDVNPGAVEDCGDSIDNDCNGDIDAADVACTPQASSAPEGFAFCAAGGAVSGATVSGRICLGPMDVGASGTIVGADATWQAGPIYVLAP